MDWLRLGDFQAACRRLRHVIEERYIEPICERALSPMFRNEPGRRAVTVHHWTGTWYNKKVENGTRLEVLLREFDVGKLNRERI